MKSIIVVFILTLLSSSVLGGQEWIGTWGTCMAETGHTLLEFDPLGSGAVFPPQILDGRTIRMIVHSSIGGGNIRLRLSNAYPTPVLPSTSKAQQFVNIGEVRVALQDVGASIVPSSDQRVKFGGNTSIIIPPNAVVLSDPIDFDLPDRVNLAVSIYITSVITGHIYAARHPLAHQTSYISTNLGDFASDVSGTQFGNTTTEWFYISAVEVLKRGHTVVALGDSITEGQGTVVDSNTRYTDYLAGRFLDTHMRVGVVNSGISGNQLNYDCPSALFAGVDCILPVGPNALARFDRDVLVVPGVKQVIVLLGTNDISISSQGLNPYPSPLDPNFVSSLTAQIVLGYRQLVERGHENGLEVYGCTIPPAQGPGSPNNTPNFELTRQAVNMKIRNGDIFDAFFDFDLILRNSTVPSQLNSTFDSGDHIHPNFRGYKAMVEEGIDLSLFS